MLVFSPNQKDKNNVIIIIIIITIIIIISWNIIKVNLRKYKKIGTSSKITPNNFLPNVTGSEFGSVTNIHVVLTVWGSWNMHSAKPHIGCYVK